jgi:hypothetical protein
MGDLGMKYHFVEVNNMILKKKVDGSWYKDKKKANLSESPFQ